MSANTQVDTYIVSNPQNPKAGHIECRRCGGRKSYRLPMAVDEYVKFIRDFNANHAACQKPARLIVGNC
jgi:hypothetical protein